MIKVVKRRVGHSFFSSKDPVDCLGDELQNFNISLIYYFDAEDLSKISMIQTNFYEEILRRVSPGSVGYVKSKVIDYIDVDYRFRELPRRYLQIERVTTRNTVLTTLFRTLAKDNNIYIAANCYLLPGINWKKFLKSIIISLMVLWLTFLYLEMTSLFLLKATYLSIIINSFTIVPFAYLSYTWIDVIQKIIRGFSLAQSLRIKFNDIDSIKESSFDRDDCVMFVKSISFIITDSIRKVLEDHGMLKPSFDDILRDVAKNIGRQTINFNMKGGIMVGSAIGGINNQVTSGEVTSVEVKSRDVTSVEVKSAEEKNSEEKN